MAAPPPITTTSKSRPSTSRGRVSIGRDGAAASVEEGRHQTGSADPHPTGSAGHHPTDAGARLQTADSVRRRTVAASFPTGGSATRPMDAALVRTRPPRLQTRAVVRHLEAVLSEAVLPEAAPGMVSVAPGAAVAIPSATTSGG